MANDYFCFQLVHVHTAVFILALFLMAIEFYVSFAEMHSFIDFQREPPVTPNMTVHEFMELTIDDAKHLFTEEILYGDGSVKFILEYICRIFGMFSHICLLIGNRTRKPKFYLPFIYYSAVGILFLIFECGQNTIEAIWVKNGHYSDIIPSQPIEVREHVFRAFLEYLLTDLVVLPLNFYLLYIVIRGKRYLEHQHVEKSQIHPVIITNTTEEPNRHAFSSAEHQI